MKEQWAYDVSTAEQAILAWKAHLVRGLNQDKARIEVIDDSAAVLAIMSDVMQQLKVAMPDLKKAF